MKSKFTLLVGTSVLFCSATALHAQEGAETLPASEDDGVLGQQADGTAEPAVGEGAIIVTGSRIRGTYSSPTPVTSLNQETLLAAAPATLADGLKQLPSIVPGGGPTAGGGTRNGGVNTLNLRGLGSDRTLILLNGRRLTPIDPTNVVDTNLIPQGLVERVDVVTGGASAAYGSDAVAGVVNFILNTRLDGQKVSASSGI
jgi:iron complex outermembrane recepter protein